MTRLDVLRDAWRRLASPALLGIAVALLLVAAACGPIGDDDDDEEPTATPTRVASPAASPAGGPIQVDEGTPGTPGPRPATDEDEDDGTPVARATPTPRPRPTESEESTPDDTGEDEDEDETPTPPTVEGCEEPEDLPPVQGEAERQVSLDADEGVNLRAAPGAECDLLATLAAGTVVEVGSGPVVAGEFVWVRVTVEGTEGWVAEEFLEPIEDVEDEEA